MGDCISGLPDDVLCRILSFVSVKDALNAKLLSRRWRPLRVPLSNLYFNQNTMLGLDYGKNWIPREHIGVLLNLKFEFVQRVDRFLKSLREGPYLNLINSFTVCFCLDNEFASRIDDWIAFAVRMDAESIELNFRSILSTINNHGKYDYEKLYSFPFHILPSGGKGSRLKHLRLTACLLTMRPETINNINNYPGLIFNSLKTLDLHLLPLDQTTLETLLTASVNLEWLVLENCELQQTTTRIRSGRLKRLHINDSCDGMYQAIELDSCVDLRAFEFRGPFTHVSFLGLGVPRLERVSLRFYNPFEKGINFMFDGLPKQLPELQMLSLCWNSCDVS